MLVIPSKKINIRQDTAKVLVKDENEHYQKIPDFHSNQSKINITNQDPQKNEIKKQTIEINSMLLFGNGRTKIIPQKNISMGINQQILSNQKIFVKGRFQGNPEQEMMHHNKDLILSMDNKKYNFQLKQDQNELIEQILRKDDEKRHLRNIVSMNESQNNKIKNEFYHKKRDSLRVSTELIYQNQDEFNQQIQNQGDNNDKIKNIQENQNLYASRKNELKNNINTKLNYEDNRQHLYLQSQALNNTIKSNTFNKINNQKVNQKILPKQTFNRNNSQSSSRKFKNDESKAENIQVLEYDVENQRMFSNPALKENRQIESRTLNQKRRLIIINSPDNQINTQKVNSSYLSPDHKTPIRMSNIQTGEKSMKAALTNINYTQMSEQSGASIRFSNTIEAKKDTKNNSILKDNQNEEKYQSINQLQQQNDIQEISKKHNQVYSSMNNSPVLHLLKQDINFSRGNHKFQNLNKLLQKEKEIIIEDKDKNQNANDQIQDSQMDFNFINSKKLQKENLKLKPTQDHESIKDYKSHSHKPKKQQQLNSPKSDQKDMTGKNQRAYQEIINHLRINRALYSQNPSKINTQTNQEASSQYVQINQMIKQRTHTEQMGILNNNIYSAINLGENPNLKQELKFIENQNKRNQTTLEQLASAKKKKNIKQQDLYVNPKDYYQ